MPVFAAFQESDLINIHVEQVSLDRTAVHVHPDGTGALKNGPLGISDQDAEPSSYPEFAWGTSPTDSTRVVSRMVSYRSRRETSESAS